MFDRIFRRAELERAKDVIADKTYMAHLRHQKALEEIAKLTTTAQVKPELIAQSISDANAAFLARDYALSLDPISVARGIRQTAMIDRVHRSINGGE